MVGDQATCCSLFVLLPGSGSHRIWKTGQKYKLELYNEGCGFTMHTNGGVAEYTLSNFFQHTIKS